MNLHTIRDISEQELFELDSNFSDEGGSLLHEQNGNTYILSLDSRGIPMEAWELKRNQETGRLEVHDANNFDWDEINKLYPTT